VEKLNKIGWDRCKINFTAIGTFPRLNVHFEIWEDEIGIEVKEIFRDESKTLFERYYKFLEWNDEEKEELSIELKNLLEAKIKELEKEISYCYVASGYITAEFDTYKFVKNVLKTIDLL
jgi:hypothetical protein